MILDIFADDLGVEKFLLYERDGSDCRVATCADVKAKFLCTFSMNCADKCVHMLMYVMFHKNSYTSATSPYASQVAMPCNIFRL